MRFKIQFLALGPATLLLAACGGGGNANKADAEKSAMADAAAPAAAPAPAATPTAAPSAAAPAADNTDTLDGTKLAALTGDPVHGKVVFAQCQACHAIVAGKNMIGPSLAGVVGRKSSSIAGYAYSTANKNSGITWTAEKLFQYLEKPMRVVPGTKMSFPGLPKAQDRADVIAYLKAPA